MSPDDTPTDSRDADRFLVEQIKRGSQDAWRQLIERYEGRLTAYARLRTAGFADAEDLVQEAFIGFVQSLPHYDPKRTLESYLFTILRYKLCDQLRQRKITPLNQPADTDDWWDAVLPETHDTPSRRAVNAEEQAAFEAVLVDLLRRLIHDLRDRSAFDDLQVIELIFYKGMRNLDIGELLDIDQKAVAGIKFRAIQKLQKFIDETSPPPPATLSETETEVTVARVWREHRLTCLKRSTLGSYILDVLDQPWRSYTQFHLDVVACPMCVANLQDLQAQELDDQKPISTQIFTSSVGFLSRTVADSRPPQ